MSKTQAKRTIFSMWCVILTAVVYFCATYEPSIPLSTHHAGHPPRSFIMSSKLVHPISLRPLRTSASSPAPPVKMRDFLRQLRQLPLQFLPVAGSERQRRNQRLAPRCRPRPPFFEGGSFSFLVSHMARRRRMGRIHVSRMTFEFDANKTPATPVGNNPMCPIRLKP